MRTEEVLLTVGAAVFSAELFDVLCWLAEKTVRYAAQLRYGASERVEVRAEEWEAIIEARPGQVLKLATALVFLGSGTWAAASRRFRRGWTSRFSSVRIFGLAPTIGSLKFFRSPSVDLFLGAGPTVGLELAVCCAAVLARFGLSLTIIISPIVLGIVIAVACGWLTAVGDVIEERARDEFATRQLGGEILARRYAHAFLAEAQSDPNPVRSGSLVRPYVLPAGECERWQTAGGIADREVPVTPRPMRLR